MSWKEEIKKEEMPMNRITQFYDELKQEITTRGKEEVLMHSMEQMAILNGGSDPFKLAEDILKMLSPYFTNADAIEILDKHRKEYYSQNKR